MYASGSIMIAMSIITIFITHHSFFGVSRFGMKVRIAVSSLTYRKVSDKHEHNSQSARLHKVVKYEKACID